MVFLQRKLLKSRTKIRKPGLEDDQLDDFGNNVSAGCPRETHQRGGTPGRSVVFILSRRLCFRIRSGGQIGVGVASTFGSPSVRTTITRVTLGTITPGGTPHRIRPCRRIPVTRLSAQTQTRRDGFDLLRLNPLLSTVSVVTDVVEPRVYWR